MSVSNARSRGTVWSTWVLVAIAVAVLGAVTLLAVRGGRDDNASIGVGQSASAVSGGAGAPVELSTDPTKGDVGVLDGAGTVRGYVRVEEPRITLPAGVRARPVLKLDGSGEIVGYFTDGPAGFVDVATARDARLLTRLIACYGAGIAHETDHAPIDATCRSALTAQGIQVSP